MADVFDLQLIESCRKGDRASQKAIYDRLASRMFPICIRYAGDRESAQKLYRYLDVSILNIGSSFHITLTKFAESD